MHAAHGGAKNKAQVIHAEAFAKELVVRGDHVVIVVLWKMRVQAVAGLRGFSVADAVGKNDVVTRGIEKLSGPKQFSGKNGRKELMSRCRQCREE